MIKIEDFKNAPVGTTATRAEGHRAMKIDDGEQSWITPTGLRVSNEHVWGLAYTLEPPAPTTAREALDMGLNVAWDLAHEVKEGQPIPKGTQYLMLHNSGLKECTAQIDFEIKPYLASITRTLDPLPDPKPDWLNAPAVIAIAESFSYRRTWVPVGDGYWASVEDGRTHWSDLRDVAPLYPLNEGTMNGTTAPEGYTPSNSMGLKNEETGA